MNARPADAHARLALALQHAPFTDDERAKLRERLSLEAGAGRIIGALRHGRPVSVDAFLAAHAVKGWDPLTSRTADPGMPPPGGLVMGWFFGAALALARLTADGGAISARTAAQMARVHYSTWSRAENGISVGVVSFLNLCAFMDRHPHDFCTPQRPCFTANMHCNTPQPQTSRPAEQPAA